MGDGIRRYRPHLHRGHSDRLGLGASGFGDWRLWVPARRGAAGAYGRRHAGRGLAGGCDDRRCGQRRGADRCRRGRPGVNRAVRSRRHRVRGLSRSAPRRFCTCIFRDRSQWSRRRIRRYRSSRSDRPVIPGWRGSRCDMCRTRSVSLLSANSPSRVEACRSWVAARGRPFGSFRCPHRW